MGFGQPSERLDNSLIKGWRLERPYTFGLGHLSVLAYRRSLALCLGTDFFVLVASV